MPDTGLFGALDPITPVPAAEEIFDALPRKHRHVALIEGAGHFPWLDVPDRYWPTINDFVMSHGVEGGRQTDQEI